MTLGTGQMLEIKFQNQFFEIPNEVTGNNGKKYSLTELIGEGGNGIVFKCEDSSSGNPYAVKILINSKKPRYQRFQREINIIKTVKHDHLITYETHGDIRISKINQNPKISSKTEKKKVLTLFIIMRIADSNLREYLSKMKFQICFEVYYSQFIGLTKALNELHCKKIIHRDIKPDNILISGDVWQISDFGLCSIVEGEEDNLTKTNEAVGPRYWMSPEAVGKVMGLDDEIGYCSDIFQLAAVFWFVVTKRPPIGILTTNDWLDDHSKPSIALCNLLIDCLQHHASRRPTTSSIFLDRIESIKYIEG